MIFLRTNGVGRRKWEITLGRVLYVVIAVFCVIPEIRKGNEIDSVG